MPRLFLAMIMLVLPVSVWSSSLRPDDSGGPLLYEQAAFDLRHVSLSLSVYPEHKTIEGTAELQLRIVQPTQRVLLDLYETFTVSSVRATLSKQAPREHSFQHQDGRLWIDFQKTVQPGEAVTVQIDYGGSPREAPRPPWVGGFTWAKTADGSPWIGVSCQLDGADLWWPTKDHPSDEPESASLHIRVPQSLKVAANGLLTGIDTHEDGTHTFRWDTALPTNAYNLTLNIAPYERLDTTFVSTDGSQVPLQFWALPENLDKAKAFLTEIKDHLRFYEEILGPYPFRKEKYGVAETPYLGMEHQTITAYGNNYQGGPFGYDWLHHHELGHEWWGNLVTVSDWRDFWLHEALCGYMQALYNEHRDGEPQYHAFFARLDREYPSHMPIAPKEPKTLAEMYMMPPDYTRSHGITWGKGAFLLHGLRYLLGRDILLESLRRFSYPKPADEMKTDGSVCRYVTSEDFIQTVEKVSGRSLTWFFEVYLRQVKLPVLIQERTEDQLALRWQTDSPFPMPIDVKIDSNIRRVALSNTTVYLDVPKDAHVEIDPLHWVLRAPDEKPSP